MILDIIIKSESMTVAISNPFNPDLDAIFDRIKEFASSRQVDIDGLDIKGLIPRIIKGIAGCENGCPADAKGLVSRGFKGFDLQYTEGGILSASSKLPDGKLFCLRMFPDF